ncbi:Pimeloyl-ACP methyl ester carboxylesterase [Desulfuromusa kysingii]|uniref:Pimeloyl-ACP methyl ester carboxylesterase n=1 Tax=Desulfuromusa kysingii TaxID=37625 RepID=A0A1H3VQ07_9BACT|nr:alpha/beta hydrolase [Desulfuromusa kysingii]SDZ76893.1 Pimeloyl-ACP methyl ester carboxylesterase [Desulfuromusa kysingii]
MEANLLAHDRRKILRKTYVSLVVFCLLMIPVSRVTASTWQVERMVTDPVFAAQVYLREAGVGNQQMLLLIHGVGPEAGSIWDDIVPDLAQKYHVIAPDLPGFGRSSKGNQLYSPEAYADFLAGLIQGLPTKPVTLAGHSLGGAIALMYAAHHGSELDRLILIDAVGLLHRLAVSQNFARQLLQFDVPFTSAKVESSLGSIASLLLEKTSRIPLDPKLVLSTPLLRKKFLAADPTRISALALVETDYSLLLEKVQTPTWLIWGTEDEIASLRIAKVLDWNLPRAELMLLPELGHSPMLEDIDSFKVALWRALQESPEGKTSRPTAAKQKVGRCDQEDGKIFSGYYSSLQINNCRDVLLRNAVVSDLQIVDSQVVIEASTLQGSAHHSALSLLRSSVVISGADIIAETGVTLNQSRIDLAGVRFVGSKSAVKAEGNPSSILCSSSVKHTGGAVETLHLSQSMVAGEHL